MRVLASSAEVHSHHRSGGLLLRHLIAFRKSPLLAAIKTPKVAQLRISYCCYVMYPCMHPCTGGILIYNLCKSVPLPNALHNALIEPNKTLHSA